jgi:hypothetical protein
LAAHLSRLDLTPRRQRAVGLAAAAVLVAAVVGLVALPTGASSAEAVVPRGDHIESRAKVGPARILVVTRKGQLRLLVAYRRGEGWRHVEVAPPPARAAAAWAATRGGAGVPALSVVYGRTDGVRVRVVWADGTSDERPVTGGVFLLARAGHVRSKTVAIMAADGTVQSTVAGP